MPVIMTRLATSSAAKYLQQMSKHFAHKVPAQWDARQAQITFDPGTCRMTADAQRLAISCESAAAEDLQRLIYIIESHLMRFAWREDVDLEWRDETGAPIAKSTKVIDMLAPQREQLAGKRRKK